MDEHRENQLTGQDKTNHQMLDIGSEWSKRKIEVRIQVLQNVFLYQNPSIVKIEKVVIASNQEDWPNAEFDSICQVCPHYRYIEIIAVDSILQIVGDTSGFFQTTITLIVVWPLQKQNCKNRTFIGTCIRYF